MDVVRITELQPKTYVEQGDYIAIDNQSDGTKKVQFTNLLDDTLSQENKIAPANVVGDEIATVKTTVENEIETIKAAVGSPLKASTVAQMTDTNKIYVYVGSESGYTNGNWYYWNGSAWTSGGVYNSVAVVTDPTLTLSGVPADAKATGDEVNNLESKISEIVKNYTNLEMYLYRKNTYLNDNGVEISLNGYDLFRIPIDSYDVCLVQSNVEFWGGLSNRYIFHLEKTDGTILRYDISMSNYTLEAFTLPTKEIILVNNGDYKAIYIGAKADLANQVDVSVNYAFSKLIDPRLGYNSIMRLTDDIVGRSRLYFSGNSNSDIQVLNDAYSTKFVHVKAGDKFVFTDEMPSSFSARGRIRYIDGTEEYVVDNRPVLKEGIANLWFVANSEDAYLYPMNSIRIEAKNVVGESESDDLTNVVTAKFNNIVDNYTNLESYFYKENRYINGSDEEIALIGHNLYMIPIKDFDVLQFKWDELFSQVTNEFVFTILLEDGTYEHPILSTGTSYYYVPSSQTLFHEATFLKGTNYKAIIVCAKVDLVSNCKVYNNKIEPILNVDIPKGVETLTPNNSILSKTYISTLGTFSHFASSNDYYTFYRKVKAGDVLKFKGTITGVSYAGLFVDSEFTQTQINLSDVEFTVPSDGIVEVFYNSTMTFSCDYYPIDSIKIDGKNVVNLDIGSSFEGLNGVAFGTSLTYRAQTAFGYLTKLAELSGITFDNQGIGSSVIKGNMLTAIKNYSDYANKRVCLLEGFVNDWYTNLPLGTYTDTTEDSVCGCVRSALNYMFSQNANMTVFLILDHYGRNVSNVDCSTTAENGSGLTQYEYYEEIAKVAKSLGIPVIKEYEVSQISENTPQYLADNIHVNALGALQSAYAIWSQMKEYYPNQI